MLQGNNLQEAQLAKEQAKILKRREDNETRRQRYLQAKVRLIGVDVQALNAQVAEKERFRQNERDIDKYERLQAIEIERILSQSIEEEKQMREFQMQQMKQSWEDAKQHQKDLAAMPGPMDFDVKNCGPAAALKFSGEDESRYDRSKRQKDQMRKWIQEQVAEKATLRHLQREEDMSFAEMLRAIDEIREATEREEAELRRYLQEQVKENNRALAREQADRRKHWNNMHFDEQGGPVGTSLPAFEEDKILALDPSGHIIRRDMFRGFTDEQRRGILMDNQNTLREKSEEREREARREADWARQQVMAIRAMEQAEYEEKMLQAALKEQEMRFLEDQREQQKRERDRWGKERFGDIGGGFFDGFGKSCR